MIRINLHQTPLEIVPHSLDVALLRTRGGDGFDFLPQDLVHVANGIIVGSDQVVGGAVDCKVGFDFFAGGEGVFAEETFVEHVVEEEDPFHEVAHDAVAVSVGIWDEARCEKCHLAFAVACESFIRELHDAEQAHD